MLGFLPQSYIKNGCSKIWLHKTLQVAILDCTNKRAAVMIYIIGNEKRKY